MSLQKINKDMVFDDLYEIFNNAARNKSHNEFLALINMPNDKVMKCGKLGSLLRSELKYKSLLELPKGMELEIKVIRDDSDSSTFNVSIYSRLSWDDMLSYILSCLKLNDEGYQYAKNYFNEFADDCMRSNYIDTIHYELVFTKGDKEGLMVIKSMKTIYNFDFSNMICNHTQYLSFEDTKGNFNINELCLNLVVNKLNDSNWVNWFTQATAHVLDAAVQIKRVPVFNKLKEIPFPKNITVLYRTYHGNITSDIKFEHELDDFFKIEKFAKSLLPMTFKIEVRNNDLLFIFSDETLNEYVNTSVLSKINVLKHLHMVTFMHKDTQKLVTAYIPLMLLNNLPISLFMKNDSTENNWRITSCTSLTPDLNKRLKENIKNGVDIAYINEYSALIDYLNSN